MARPLVISVKRDMVKAGEAEFAYPAKPTKPKRRKGGTGGFSAKHREVADAKRLKRQAAMLEILRRSGPDLTAAEAGRLMNLVGIRPNRSAQRLLDGLVERDLATRKAGYRGGFTTWTAKP
jgi:hypothetical protein